MTEHDVTYQTEDHNGSHAYCRCGHVSQAPTPAAALAKHAGHYGIEQARQSLATGRHLEAVPDPEGTDGT